MSPTTRKTIEGIKSSVAIESVIAETVPLRRRGAHLIGKCPFHDDEHPSLIVTPAKVGTYGLFNCPACSVGGDVITWVQRLRGLSFSEAVAWLTNSAERYSSKAPSENASRPSSKPVALTATHLRWMNLAASHYRHTLAATPKALEALMNRGFANGEVLQRFGLGFCEGSLGRVLPADSTAEGREARRALREVTLLLPKDRELLDGCLVIPQFGERDTIVSFSGRRIESSVDKASRHLSLGHRGIVNRTALSVYSTMIVTESPIDAMSCAEAGFWNTTCLYGVNGFPAELKDALTKSTRRVILWLDADDAGRAAPSSGKSTVQKTVAKLCPEEDKKSWSAVTGRALNYMGENELAGKAILKGLLTEYRASTATTAKNPATNRFECTEYNVRGPIALISTSTIDPGAEFSTRMLNSPMTMGTEQTKAVQTRLRQARGREGFEQEEARGAHSVAPQCAARA